MRRRPNSAMGASKAENPAGGGSTPVGSCMRTLEGPAERESSGAAPSYTCNYYSERCYSDSNWLSKPRCLAYTEVSEAGGYD
jgi:hypothetical protein